MTPGTKPVPEMSKQEVADELRRLEGEFQAIEVKPTPAEVVATEIKEEFDAQEREFYERRMEDLRRRRVSAENEQRNLNNIFLGYVKEKHSDLLAPYLSDEAKSKIKALVRESRPELMESIYKNDARLRITGNMLVSGPPVHITGGIPRPLFVELEKEGTLFAKKFKLLSVSEPEVLVRMRQLINRFRSFLYAEKIVADANAEVKSVEAALARVKSIQDNCNARLALVQAGAEEPEHCFTLLGKESDLLHNLFCERDLPISGEAQHEDYEEDDKDY